MEIVEKTTTKDKNLTGKRIAKNAEQTKTTTTAATVPPIKKDTNAATTTTIIAKSSELNATDAANSNSITTTTTTATAMDMKLSNPPKQQETSVAGKMATSLDTEIISISDGEDSAPSIVTPSTESQPKKRKSVGGAAMTKSGEEKHFKLKRRKINVAGAPKMPLTGYVRYMNDRRESLRKEQPQKTAMEHTKLIGEEWNQLSEERRTPYMQAAEVDKKRYLTELHVFLKAHPDVLARELAKNKQRKSTDAAGSGGKSVLKEKAQSNGNSNSTDVKETSKQTTKDDLAITTAAKTARSATHTRRLSVNYMMPPNHLSKDTSPPAATTVAEKIKPKNSTPTTQSANATRKRTPTPPSNNNNNNNNHSAPVFATPVPGEIPIFTNEFLEHNKNFDMELRTLRKSKADLEQQNAVLEKHVENMKFGVEKMAHENDELQEKNRLLEIYLDKLKRKLANALSGLAIPTEPNGATVENIDKYMNDLYKMSTSNTHGPASLNKAKDIIRKLDLQIQL